MQQLLDIHVARSDEQLTVTLAGELDVVSSRFLEQRFSELAPMPRTVLDMEHVSFVDSTGLRAMWLLHQRCASNGASLVLRSPSTAVRRLLELTGLESQFATE